jgi:FMN-dependent oxidoreductase (nitrilotriacetate monooxygenase family)
MKRPAHLNLFVAGHGYHEASWRMPTSSGGPLGLDHFVSIARLAERGVLDSIFFADAPGVALFRTRFMAQAGFDPIDVLAALAAVTSHVGLIATASTTYGTPWDVARRFATLDHLSGGRAGWNVVTTGNPVAAANFGDRPHAPHDDRYQRAQEFVEVVRAVWDGWDDDAVVADAAGGTWADTAKLHPPHHHGEHFSVDGILGIPRAPQGHPVLVQAGSSAQGVDLAGRFADLVFTPQSTIPDAIEFRRRLQAVAEAHGRRADDVRTLPGLSFVLGGTQAEAERGWRDLQDASQPAFRLFNLANLAGVDPAVVDDLDPDGPFPYELFEQAATVTFAQAVMRTARQDGLTFRQTAERFATLPGGLHLTGTPEQLADLIEAWWRQEAADGFTLQPLRLPLDAAAFVDAVVPILQRRGVTAEGYADGTLRDRLGLRRPPDRATRDRSDTAAGG